jgi:hypothetical protein
MCPLARVWLCPIWLLIPSSPLIGSDAVHTLIYEWVQLLQPRCSTRDKPEGRMNDAYIAWRLERSRPRLDNGSASASFLDYRHEGSSSQCTNTTKRTYGPLSVIWEFLPMIVNLSEVTYCDADQDMERHTSRLLQTPPNVLDPLRVHQCRSVYSRCRVP